MKQLRAIRILMATLFSLAIAACLLIGPQIHPMARAAWKSQIILSALAATSGAAFVWLLLTFLFGRIYCAGVCPIGSLSDGFSALFRKIDRKMGRKRVYSYREPTRLQLNILLVYLVCIVLGIGLVPLLLEPWNITRNILTPIRPDLADSTWGRLGFGAVIGIVAGVVSAVLLAAISARRGRFFCTSVCPVGGALSLIGSRSVIHLEIDRDACDVCGICEEVCPAECVKVLDRTIDNSRCVRCFECGAACPREAIHYQMNRNMPFTPLFRRAKQRT